MHQEVGFGRHFKGGAKGLHKIVGQFADEPHRVAQQHGLAAGQVEAAGAGIEGGEEAVGDVFIGVGQLVENGALARVGVAHERDHRQPGAQASPPLGVAGAGEGLQIAFELVDAALQTATVDFELSFAGATGADEGPRSTSGSSAGLLGKLCAPAPQSGQTVTEESQLNLGLTLLRAGRLGEDVEDHICLLYTSPSPRD